MWPCWWNLDGFHTLKACLSQGSHAYAAQMLVLDVLCTTVLCSRPATIAAVQIWVEYPRFQTRVHLSGLQTCTMYKEGGRILPKEFSFKIQNVRGNGAEASRKTIGKIKVDMAQFCTADEAAVPQEVYLQLK